MTGLSRTWLSLALAVAGFSAQAGETPREWSRITLADPSQVELGGPLGNALQRGIARTGEAPYSSEWLLADISFEVDRIYTCFSGDVSGRFIELGSLASPPDRRISPAFVAVIANVCRYQKPDGHFGADVDLKQPLVQGSPAFPMLFGNARMLVGLLAAAERFHNDEFLTAAKRLGDYYIATSADLCSPARMAEYRATGNGGFSYTCCYFPAIESLALLYRKTRDDRYLQLAERMAEQFKGYDALPIDHSHGNLLAWRGILLLYEITGKPMYLEWTRAKWESAVTGGYVWPIGGVGEHWYVSYHLDEGCSESDWLRLNLDLWRHTGKVRYLDMSERLLWNQYLANQSPDGGYGGREFEGDASGPTATLGILGEGLACCTFHGPLGMYFFKAYLATASELGVLINFPVDFTSTVKATGGDWQVSVNRKPDAPSDAAAIEITVTPCGATSPETPAILVRVPGWARRVEFADAAGQPLSSSVRDGYACVDRHVRPGEKITVTFQVTLALEARHFETVEAKPGEITRLHDVALTLGPQVLFATPAIASGRPVLLATIDRDGRLGLVRSASIGAGPNARATVALPRIEADEAEIRAAVRSSRPILFRPWPQLPTTRRAPFMCDLVVVPDTLLDDKDLADWPQRVQEATLRLGQPIFGDHLEKRPENWLAPSGWNFTPSGLLVAGGDVGLLDGGGYGDYRFEFELVLPNDGQGVAGFVVRGISDNDCVMYQLQSADSQYQSPDRKPCPNSLLPRLRLYHQWQKSDPVPLPMEVRRGQSYKIAVECRGNRVEVFLDGAKIHAYDVPYLRTGGIGFYAAGPLEKALFREIAVRKL